MSDRASVLASRKGAAPPCSPRRFAPAAARGAPAASLALVCGALARTPCGRRRRDAPQGSGSGCRKSCLHDHTSRSPLERPPLALPSCTSLACSTNGRACGAPSRWSGESTQRPTGAPRETELAALHRTVLHEELDPCYVYCVSPCPPAPQESPARFPGESRLATGMKMREPLPAVSAWGQAFALQTLEEDCGQVLSGTLVCGCGERPSRETIDPPWNNRRRTSSSAPPSERSLEALSRPSTSTSLEDHRRQPCFRAGR